MLVILVCAAAAVLDMDTLPKFVMVAEPVTSPVMAMSGSLTLKSNVPSPSS